VIPAAFEYSRAKSVDDALNLLAQHQGSAKVIAGGQSLLPLLKLRVASAERLIDIGRLNELRGIREWEGGIAIGALTTYREVLESPLTKKFPILAEAIIDVGDVQVRNRGTIGGSIAHADPASDFPAVAIALDAQIVLRSKSGERVVPAEQFLQGAFQTDIHEDELLTEVRIPAAAASAGQAYVKLEQPASGYSIVGVAAVIKDVHGVMGSGKLESVRIGITGVGDVAYRASAVEAVVTGAACDAADITGAADHATDNQMVGSDIHADRTYRTAMAKVYTRRAIEAALHRTP
jgi:carbon-monoxide dehydrogenase medium subunit